MSKSRNKKLQQIELRSKGDLSLAQEGLEQELSPTKSLNEKPKSKFKTIIFQMMGIKQNKKKKFQWPIYKKLLSYAYKQWKLFTFSIITLLASSFLTSALPYMVGILLDNITQAKESNTSFEDFKLQGSQMEILIVLLVLTVMTAIRVVASDVLQQRVAISLRVDVFKHFIYNDIHFFQKYKTGQLNSRLGNDINQAKSAVSNNITFLLRNVITMIGNICVLMFMSWRLTLLVLVIVPLYGIVTIIHNRNTKKLVRKYQDIVSEISSQVNEVFSGIQIVKSYCGQDVEAEKYLQISQRAYGISFKKALFSSLFVTSTVFLPNLGIIFVIWYGGNLVLNGSTLTAGQLTSFIIYCGALSNSASSISNSYSNIINGTSAVQKVFQLMEYKPDIDQKSVNLPSKELQGQIEFVDVDFRYPKGQVYVLKKLNLHIRKGQYIAFVGQSGSGKSTIVKLLQRFYEIQSGNIFLDDSNVNTLNVKSIRSQIGFVSQEPLLFSGTIQQNITYGLKDYSYDDMVEVCRKTGCMEFIGNKKLFPDGFKTQVGERGCQLSGGQRQRISIARALIKKPKILIFDEATSALDSNSEFIVQQQIQNLVTQTANKITILIIAHRLSTIINADRIFVMKYGEIIEEGTHESLLELKGCYSQLIEKQLQKRIRSSRSIKLQEEN